MKILKTLLYLLIGLIVIFFAIGWMNPSVTYGHEISVNKSVKEAWAVMQDESKYDQWLEGYQGMELISGEAGAIGSKYRVVVNPGEGQDDFEMIQTLISMDEFERVELHYDSEMMKFEQVFSFSGTDENATMKSDAKVLGKGLFARAMFATMEMFGSFTAQETKNIEALKTLIEANTTDYFPQPEVLEAVDSTETI